MFISQTIFVAGVAYEQAKREALARGKLACERSVSRLSALIDEYDRKHYQTVPCSGDILCERQNRRHRNGCIGRTEPFNAYVKGLS